MFTDIIGIDPGTNTGIAVYNIKSDALILVETRMIHRAMDYVLNRWQSLARENYLIRIKVYLEDSRNVSRGGKNAAFMAQGAGSIKRDCSIWEDFLKDYGIDHQFIRPGKNSKLKVTAEYFKKVTGWEGRTSNHSRDAGMLCYRRTH